MDDSALFPEGVTRCSFKTFSLWALFLLAVIGWGALGAFLVLYKGLNVTGLDDYFGFGLWITADLGIIALGAGAFFTGFMTYVIGKKELKSIINLAVIVGFLCYSGAMAVLGIDIGQPIRGWFGFWHPNVHSMLTEVMFCITMYLMVLAIEFLPIILENRKLDEIGEIHLFSHNLHEVMAVFAGVGTFLSFFHQGSLGGMFGVLTGRPFGFREGFFVWPWTFFLFFLSAVASGPSFTLAIAFLMEKVTGKRLVKKDAVNLLAKISGGMLCVYLAFKFVDTYYWATVLLPSYGQKLSDFYHGGYGMWLLVAELVICGVVPATMLLCPWVREHRGYLALACVLNCTGIVINRFVFTVQTLAIPVMPFDTWMSYFPTWQEWSITFAMLAYGALVVSLAYRYLPVFPHEKELNPS